MTDDAPPHEGRRDLHATEPPDDPTNSPSAVGGSEDTPTEAEVIAALTRRTNLLIGVLGMLLLGAFAVIGLLFGRVASAESDASAARAELAAFAADPSVATGASAGELTELRDDIERVEAGAALYASQIDGFREQLTELAPQIEAGVDEAITGLRDFGESTLAFDVDIDEVIPIDTEVVIERTVEVPIETEIPINQEIDTTIRIDTPFGGIPLDITVPVDVVVPIDLTVDIPIDETVPVQDEFPVQFDVPIAIDVSETELKNLTDSLATGLESLQDILTSLNTD